MKQAEDQWFREALSGVERKARPSDAQKDKMLTHILNASLPGTTAWQERLLHLVTICPWRFAFCVSAVQAVLGTLIWGTKYTSLLLGFMMGG